MQGLKFHPSLPWYANYGGMGSILGHELTHGFDDTGREYDENGNHLPWWDNDTVAEFQRRAECFVGQFNNFTLDGPTGPLHVNGQLTLGENLADAGGLNVAYDTWIANRAALELSLPGLQMFTHEQLYFVFYANVWCSTRTPPPGDTHSPDMIRIKAMMQNSRAFKEAFNCSVKEPVCELCEED